MRYTNNINNNSSRDPLNSRVHLLNNNRKPKRIWTRELKQSLHVSTSRKSNSDNNYFGNIFWPGKKSIITTQTGLRSTYLMSNLNSAVKNAVAKTAQTGYCNETIREPA